MEILSQYKPWLMVTQDDSRPVLAHCYVERIEGAHGLLVAADGFMLGVFPVLLDPDDVPGLVPARLIRRARKGGCYKVGLGAEAWVMPDEAQYKRRAPAGAYPNYRTIIQAGLESIKAGSAFYDFAVSADLIRRLSQALGLHAICIHFGSEPMRPFLVTDSLRRERIYQEGKPLDAAFAVLMPMQKAERDFDLEPRDNGKGQFWTDPVTAS